MKQSKSKTVINIKLIENYIKEHKLSKKQFAQMCNISTWVLRKVLKNNTNFRIVYLFRIARVLNIKIKDIFIKEEKL